MHEKEPEMNLKERVTIIAEAGVNHNGSLEIAKRLVDAAKEAGADVVKFQTANASASITSNTKTAEYQNTNTGDTTQLSMIEKLELPFSDYIEIKKYCDQVGIIFATTFFDRVGGEFSLNNLHLPFCKVASGEITNLPLLEMIGRSGLPVLLSTGMATLEEVQEAISILKTNGSNEIIVLHCTTEYPAPKREVNLRAMVRMGNYFNMEYGYSDHTEGIEIPVAAVAMGARVIEKHLTLDRAMEGPDHKASLEPREFKKMVLSIRNIEEALGSSKKAPTKAEQKNVDIVRKSIVAAKDISIGDVFTVENITTKRPGTGISPMRWYEVLGKKANNNFKKDDLITL